MIIILVPVDHIRYCQSIDVRHRKLVWRCQLGYLDVLAAMKCEFESTSYTWTHWNEWVVIGYHFHRRMFITSRC